MLMIQVCKESPLQSNRAKLYSTFFVDPNITLGFVSALWSSYKDKKGQQIPVNQSIRIWLTQ